MVDAKTKIGKIKQKTHLIEKLHRLTIGRVVGILRADFTTITTETKGFKNQACWSGKEHMTMLIVTHEMSFAKDISDWVVFMDGGYVVEEGPPDQVFVSPKQERTKNFLRKILGNT